MPDFNPAKCGCSGCQRDRAPTWPPGRWGIAESFDWHCARVYGWGEWFAYGDELI